MVERVCKICGEVFYTNIHNKQCCSPECSKKNTLKTGKRWYSNSRKAKQQEVTAQRLNVCDEFCEGCVYMAQLSDVTVCCNYFLSTGARRPCLAGTGCTVKETGEKRTQWRKEADEEWSKLKEARKRARKNERERERWRKKREAMVKTKVCPICGMEFQTGDSKRRYCSQACSYTARKSQYSAYDKKRAENANN